MICIIFEKSIFEKYLVPKSDFLNFFVTAKVFGEKNLQISSNMRLILNFRIKCTENFFH